MNKQLTLFFLFVISQTFGQIPAGYYDSAQGLTGYQLKTALSQIIDNHTVYSYNDLYDIYEDSDTDNYYENDGSVLDIYSEKPNGPDAYEYQHHQNTCGQYSGEGDCYNREHILPQSIFGSASPMKSDAHFVVPTDGYVNNRRSSYPFGEVNNPTWTSTNGSKLGANSTQGYSGTVFEPIDEFKGDIARMLFYVATRYESEIAGWGSTDMLDGTADHVFSDWFLQILMTWNNQDPVSQREIDRNNAVYNWQHNRNPFIDHPEWVDAIWNPNPDTTPPSVPSGVVATNISDTSFTITWHASTDDRGVASYDIYLNNQLAGNTTDTQYTLTGLSPSTTYSICIKAKDTSGNISACSASLTVTTAQAVNYLIDESFDNCPTMSFVVINEASNKNWECIGQYGENNSPAIQVNGYQEDVLSKDWLISQNAIDFDNYNNEQLSMFLAYAYGTTPLEVVYSNSYDGNGQPWLFNWIAVPNVNIPVPDGSSSTTELTVNNADISAINGTAYIAFKYYSNGSPTRWTVDSVKLSAEYSNTINQYIAGNINIYPNPVATGHMIYIQANDLNINDIRIYDMTGKIIPVLFDKSTKTININRLTAGIYLLHIMTTKGTVNKKLIIE